MTLTAQLLRAGQALPSDQPIPIGPDGTTLQVAVPAGLQLTGAELRLTLPDDAAALDLTAGSIVATDRGPGSPPSAAPVLWVSHDWRVRRPLVRLAVTLKAGADATHVRLRLSDGGPWLLASPGPLIEVKSVDGALVAAAQLPGLAASRVLLELVKKAGTVLNPEDIPFAAASTIASIVLTGARRPPGLTLRLGDAIVHHEPALLPAGGQLAIPLTSLVRDLLPGGAGGPLALRLDAPAESLLKRIDLSLQTRALVTRFAGDRAAIVAQVPAGGQLVAELPLAQAPTRLRLRVRADPRDEVRLPVPAFPDAPRHGHRCTPDSALAQRFTLPAGAGLLGVDLLLGPRSPALRGRVGFHADELGVPQEPPFAAIDLALADIAGAGLAPTARAVVLDLPAPVRPPGERCWISLALAEGQAVWFFGQAELGAPPPVRRERAEPWVPRDMPFATGITAPWACAQPRLRRGRAPEPPSLALRWGAELYPLAPDPSGRLDLAAAELPPAPEPPGSASLDLVVTCPFAARVELEGLSVDMPEQTTHLSFGT